MDYTSTTDSKGSQDRYSGYDRIMGNISWLLIALVSLAIKMLPPDEDSIFFLAVLCILLFIYNVSMRYIVLSGQSGQYKTFVDLMVFLCFIVAVCWFTGKVTSPFISLLYLVLMATSLTQGKKVTYLMAGLAISSYIFLTMEQFSLQQYEYTLVGEILNLFPFLLIAHLGAMLSGEAETARREVEHMSLTDEITGLNNMRNFVNLSVLQEKVARRYEKEFTICMLDADNLKQINDRHGHLAGTALIRHMGKIIEKNIRESDIPARYGGDEFVIMFLDSGKDRSRIPVERIVADLAQTPFSSNGLMLSTTLSAGIASFPLDGEDVTSVMAKADEAMYQSKRDGKNRLTVYRHPFANE
jgi:diguanylate cyclase (GGDEF)-like protein